MLQQRYSQFKSKKPYFRGVKEADFHKNSNSVFKTISVGFGHTAIELICFLKDFMQKSDKKDFIKELWVPISKGLKHLNIVLELEAKNAAKELGLQPTPNRFLTSPAVTVTQLLFISSCHTMTVYFMDHDSASFSWFCSYQLGLIMFHCVLPTMSFNVCTLT